MTDPVEHTGTRADRVASLAAQIVLLGVVPVLLLAGWIAATVRNRYAFDFHGSLWEGSRDIMAGRNPYPPPTVGGIASADQFVYPPLAALLTIPLGVLPYPWAAGVMTVLVLAAMSGALLALHVRDWRCHGATLASLMMLQDVRLGAITTFLVLGVALVWRWRESTYAAVPFALVVVLKVFLWPLGIWLLATRRVRTTGSAVLLALGLLLGSWAVIGFAGLRDYPDLLRVLAQTMQAKGFSVVAAGISVGVTASTARIVELCLGLALLAWAAIAGRRGADFHSFTLAIGACLVLTPMVWLNYFLFLYIPIAINSPRFSIRWLLPLAFWVTPFLGGPGSAWAIFYADAVALVIFVWSARTGPGSGLAKRHRTGKAATSAAPLRFDRSNRATKE